MNTLRCPGIFYKPRVVTDRANFLFFALVIVDLGNKSHKIVWIKQHFADCGKCFQLGGFVSLRLSTEHSSKLCRSDKSSRRMQKEKSPTFFSEEIDSNQCVSRENFSSVQSCSDLSIF